MQLLYESTEQFEKDLNTLPAEERQKVVNAINRLGQLALSDRPALLARVERPITQPLQLGGESTLYISRVGRHRLVFTVDDDPIFDQIIVTLFRNVDRVTLPPAVRQVAEALYPEVRNGRQNGVQGKAAGR